MLSLKQFVLAKIAEECTEVGKRALKQSQFGEHQHDEGYLSNVRRLQDETTDLAMWLGVAQRLQIALPVGNIYTRYREKRAKILRVLNISVVEGQVDPTVLEYFQDHEDLLP